ncbi:hypothetical protein CHM34_00305 [Paludifilum halophilum]|uniref:DUF2512 domain-containing protein n=2 Tax=Paludifilum halophilum TaxID=1642702 RepID=A0A235BB14_9BACL|nr:hypothetical protein CHM34_00305 [Paludifilum halophilum]
MAWIIKFALTTFLLFVILGGFYDVSFTDVFLLSVLLTVLGYVGDVFILPRVGNLAASLGDFGLALIIIGWMGFYRFDEDVSLIGASLISSFAIAVGEWFFHKYMKNTILEREAVS